jgi:prolyl oligopeptidase
MDPYQHIRDGVRYPAVLLNIGLNDGRVSSWHTGKFAARLQTASTSGKPILIRVDEDAGHMAAASTRDQVAALEADRWALLFWQLGGRR